VDTTDATLGSQHAPTETFVTTVTLPGGLGSAACARRHIRAALAGHPSMDTAELLVGELVTNAIRYSRSSLPGGRIVLNVTERDQAIRVEVIDDGADNSTPHLVDTDAMSPRGRGLWIVQAQAPWGVERRGGRTVVWFELVPTAYGT
jgi:serine/threonine-protein kinase RsbW